ncbi:hypothetical protein OIU78_027451 [Salix suchowensis]|nr:hypothetical protein OIU78_027451 [Salix suchowensis]
MEDEMVDQYWCHMCSQMVNPVPEAEIKCPFCESGFLEEMGSVREVNNIIFYLGSDHAFSLWDTFLLDHMGGLGTSGSRRRAEEHIGSTSSQDEDDELDFESLLRRRGRLSTASVQRLLQDLHLRSGPNRHGTPPAEKEAVKAMPTVSITENLQCSICLEEFDIVCEAKEMPCQT